MDFDWTRDQQNLITFVMLDASRNELTGLGSGFDLQISKAGGPFQAGAGVKAELGYGWYSYTSTVAEANTIGPVSIVVTGVGAIQQNLTYDVVDYYVPVPSPVPSPALVTGYKWANAVDFVQFWCYAKVLRGVHNGAPSVLSLSDSLQDFISQQVRLGDYLVNLSDVSSGPIVSPILNTTITAFPLTGGVSNIWDTGNQYAVVFAPYEEVVGIEYFLSIAAGDILMALQSSGQGDCSPSSAGLSYLKKLNIIMAAVVHNCPCGDVGSRWSDDMKAAWLEWVNKQIDKITSGEYEICEGQTGKLYPAAVYAEVNLNEFTTRRILSNSLNRRGY